eukprot:CAMPEP_0171802906 /NCGR_PEP_ID=MMETSP0991-20121206/73149_1 /TAXON_ID=483369 /ORGANISM="non described non described, Strain CCMP2098" /LENGTH=67 /DNA_ID=CAMNT_0012414887 /DNA_START=336 /DNA_END=535 /DNA_ORIENTATION=+
MVALCWNCSEPSVAALICFMEEPASAVFAANLLRSPDSLTKWPPNTGSSMSSVAVLLAAALLLLLLL